MSRATGGTFYPVIVRVIQSIEATLAEHE